MEQVWNEHGTARRRQHYKIIFVDAGCWHKGQLSTVPRISLHLTEGQQAPAWVVSNMAKSLRLLLFFRLVFLSSVWCHSILELIEVLA